MPLQLTLPELDEKNPNLNPEIRPRQVESWLEKLPFGNPLEAGRMMGDGLTTLNRVKLDFNTRWELSELYRNTILSLWPALETQYRDNTLPLRNKGQLAAKLAKTLANEMAYTYKILLKQRIDKKINFSGNKQLIQLMQRVQHALARLLAISYHTYSAPPKKVWLEMHQIYQCALEQKLEDEMIMEGGVSRSISVWYKQALLLSLSDPFRLVRGNFDRVLEYLARYGHLAQLSRTAPDNKKIAAMFVINPHQDTPPQPLSKVKADSTDDIFLNSFDLIITLERQHKKLENGVSPKALDLPNYAAEPSYLALLKHLIRNWGIGTKRGSQRIQSTSKIEVCIGMSSIWYFLNNQKTFVNPDYPAISIDTDTLAPPAKNRRVSVEPTYNYQEWMVVNQSTEGFTLKQITGNSSNLHVGEVVALRANSSAAWYVGVVRWIQSNGPEDLDFGVQVLAPTASPVAIKPVVAKAEQIYLTAILLPAVPALKRSASLIAPVGNFRNQREFSLFEKGKTRVVRAVQLIEQTADFEQFQFGD